MADVSKFSLFCCGYYDSWSFGMVCFNRVGVLNTLFGYILAFKYSWAFLPWLSIAADCFDTVGS